jgi:hypothetical protein
MDPWKIVGWVCVVAGIVILAHAARRIARDTQNGGADDYDD